MKAAEVYAGSDGEVTKAYYANLMDKGAVGIVAMNLFRAQKCSARAKVYRGRGYRDEAYERKQWSMGQLCECLAARPELRIKFGWKEDPGAHVPWLLYIDLPQGQVSFHSPERGKGPDYLGEWDQQHSSEERILEFCDMVMEGKCAVGNLNHPSETSTTHWSGAAIDLRTGCTATTEHRESDSATSGGTAMQLSLPM